MRIGQPAKISATTVPADVALTWSSDNTDSCTVDHEGNVTGLEWWTEAKITASFVYDGETYSDSVRVCVREYDLEAPLMHEDFWTDASKWNEEPSYTDNGRKTYIEYSPTLGMFNDGGVDLKYNPEGTQSSIFMRLVPSPSIEYDESKDYFLEMYFNITWDRGFEFEFNDGLLARDGWNNRQQIPPAEEDVYYYPLKQGTNLSRLCLIQVRSDGQAEPRPQDLHEVSFAIVSKPKV